MANPEIEDDIFGTELDLFILCFLGGAVFLVEFGAYSGLKYILFESEKSIAGIVWNLIKLIPLSLTIIAIFVFIINWY